MTDATTMAVFVDTNCFLQLRDLKDLPWADLLPGVSHIEIMVVPAVIDELDAKKIDGKERIRNRARAANKLILAASEQAPMRMMLKEGPVTVAFNVVDVDPTDWTRHPKLDPTRADDVLVAQALEAPCDSERCLLSHDSGPLVKARRLGLKALSPPGGWLLPDTVDDDRKQLQQLKRENEQLKARYPKIVTGWGNAVVPLDAVVVEQLIVPELGETAVRALLARCKSQWPMATATFSAVSGLSIGEDDTSGAFTHGAYESYVAKHQTFMAGLPDVFLKLHQRVAAASRIGQADFFLRNDGSATAERLIATYAASDGWRVVTNEKDAQELKRTPIAPPDPPLTPHQSDVASRARRADQAGAVFPRLSGAAAERRDPESFYWNSGHMFDSDTGTLECSEFRAKRQFECEIWLYPTGSPPQEGRLHLDIHGHNLSDPIEAILPLRYTARHAEWTDPAVKTLLAPWLADALAAL